MAKPHQFPKANAYASHKPIVFCPKAKVLVLWNQNHKSAKPMSSLTDKVANWFDIQSQNHGWAGAVLAPTVGTRHHAGCLLVQHDSKVVLAVFVKGNR